MQTGLTPATDQVVEEASACVRNLRQFIRAGWHVLEPATPYHHGWHIDAISEHLEAVTDGSIRNLIINIPPRHMKSLCVSVFWPTWEWLTKPETRWIFASYSSYLSRRDNGKALQLIESPWFQERWGGTVKIRHDSSAKARFENTRTGYRFATSVQGSLTGEGGDRLCADDPHNVRGAESAAIRNATLEWWDKAMSSRGNNPQTVAKLVIMQRVHEADLTGHLLAQGGYEHLCLPAEYDGQRRQTSISTLPSYQPDQATTARHASLNATEEPRPFAADGSYDPRTEEGDLLWPDHFGRPELDELKLRLGPYATAGQLQQAPAPAEGGFLKRVWWRYWQFPGQQLPPVTVKTEDGYEMIEPVTLPAAFDDVAQSWDMAFKGGQNSSYVTGQVWAKRGASKYLLDQLRDQMDMPQTLAAVRALVAKWPRAFAKLVEDKANGPAVIAMLRQEISGMLPMTWPIDLNNKEGRVQAVVPQIHAGNVFLPHPQLAPAITEGLINECASFPNGANNDQVDSLTQALLYWELGGCWSEGELQL